MGIREILLDSLPKTNAHVDLTDSQTRTPMGESVQKSRS